MGAAGWSLSSDAEFTRTTGIDLCFTRAPVFQLVFIPIIGQPIQAQPVLTAPLFQGATVDIGHFGPGCRVTARYAVTQGHFRALNGRLAPTQYRTGARITAAVVDQYLFAIHHLPDPDAIDAR